jgi:hypothetical protein
VSIEDSREVARQQVHDLLGISPNTTQLFDLAATTFGQIRADRCRELASRAPLTRRSMACSVVAQLIVASRHLGSNWWEGEHEHMDAPGHWTLAGTPDLLLERGTDVADYSSVGSSLGLLGDWACDDAADAEWGRPIDFVDLNDPRPDDRVWIPEDARVGDRLTASYEPGGRVRVEVVERRSEDPILEELGHRRGHVGSHILAEVLCCEAADAGWAWGMATNASLVRLPGETPHTQSDPFEQPISNSAAERLYAELIEIGVTTELVGSPWKTKGDLLEASCRLGWPYAEASLFRWCRAMEQAIDSNDP